MLKISPLRFGIVLAALCALGITHGGDFTVDTSNAPGIISWRDEVHLTLGFEPYQTRQSHFAENSRKRTDQLPDGRTVVNYFGEEKFNWRSEMVIDKEGREVEFSIGVGCPVAFQNSASQQYEFRIPWKELAGKKFKMLVGIREDIKVQEGVFDDSFTKADWVRLIAVGDGVTPGPVFDLNPRGSMAYDSDEITSTAVGSWFVTRTQDELLITRVFSLNSNGNYFGAKIRCFTGVLEDYFHRHARIHYYYSKPLFAKHRLTFGSAKHGKNYTIADGAAYSNQTGYGWLNNFTPAFDTEAPEGAYYSAASGKSAATFRFGKLDSGYYMLTVGAGNLKGKDHTFSVKLNGESMVKDFTLPTGHAVDLSKAIHVSDGNLDVTFSGDWRVSQMTLQPLLNDLEDFVFQRGLWVIDEAEPLTGMSSNAYYKDKPVFPLGKELYTLPEPGREMVGQLKPFVRESCLPNTDTPEAAWQKHLNIGSFGGNMNAIAAMLPEDAAEKIARSNIEAGRNFLIHNGIFSRHLYAGETALAEIPVLKRLVDAGHKGGLHILDHQDFALLWDCGSGMRTLVAMTPALQRSIFDHTVHGTICPNDREYMEKFFARTVNLIRETGIDALMLDEVWFFNEAGCCGCAECREDFHKETGWYLPVNELSPELNNSKSILWRRWREYQAKKLGDWWVALRKRINPIRPDFLFVGYCTHRYFVEGWINLEPLRAGYMFGTEILNRNVFNSARSTFSYRKLKNLVFNCYNVPGWGLFYNGSDYIIAYAGWAMNNMNGQSTWNGSGVDFPFMHFKGNMDPVTARPIMDAALLFSQKSQSGEREPNIHDYYWMPGKLMGVAQTLDAMHVPYGFIDESFLTDEKLAQYKVLMIPAAMVMTGDEIKAVKKYVQNGGRLMITSVTGALDELWQKRSPWPFAEWFGAEPGEVVMSRSVNQDGASKEFANPIFFNRLTGRFKPEIQTSMKHRGAGSTPLVMSTKAGKGVVYWLNGDLFRNIYEEEWYQPGNTYGFALDEVQNQAAQKVLNELLGDTLFCRIKAPEKVLTSHYRDGKKVILHFFNHTGFNVPKGEKLPATWPRNSFPQLAEPIQVELQASDVKSVYAVSPDFEGRKAISFQNGSKPGTIHFEIPVDALKAYTIVYVE